MCIIKDAVGGRRRDREGRGGQPGVDTRRYATAALRRVLEPERERERDPRNVREGARRRRRRHVHIRYVRRVARVRAEPPRNFALTSRAGGGVPRARAASRARVGESPGRNSRSPDFALLTLVAACAPRCTRTRPVVRSRDRPLVHRRPSSLLPLRFLGSPPFPSLAVRESTGPLGTSRTYGHAVASGS